MQVFENDFLSVFLIQSRRPGGSESEDYRWEVPLTPFQASWALRGIPDGSPAHRRETEPRLRARDRPNTGGDRVDLRLNRNERHARRTDRSHAK